MTFSYAAVAAVFAAAIQANEFYQAECPDFSNEEHFDTPTYQAMSAYCKQEAIWKKVIKDRTSAKFFVGDEFKDLFVQSVRVSFETVSDTIPLKREKYLHPVGVVTQVEFIPTPDTPYTGCFKGFKHGIMRISEVTQTTPEIIKTSPSHAVKCLRDGMSSGNWFAMFAFDGQPSFNYFKHRWTNILREMDNECHHHTIGKRSAEGSEYIGALSLMEFSEYDELGQRAYEPNWPFQIDVQPYDAYGWTDEYQNDFRVQLSVIPPDTSMFKVFAYEVPPEFGGQERLIGWIVSRSETTTSLWGDEQLFFQHRAYEDDLKVRPYYEQWLVQWKYGTFSEQPLWDPAPMQRCPFMFLWGI